MRTTRIAVLLACIVVTIGIGQSTSIRYFIQDARGEWDQEKLLESASVPVFAPQKEPSVQKDALYQEIEAKRIETRIAPIEPVVDRVWKAIPGYNGMEIDVEETYKQAKSKENKGKIQYIYRQIPPSKSLEELGAEPIYRGNPNKPMVSLMINVAWGNEFIGPMLDTLDEKKAKATFFFDGSWLSKNQEIALEIQKRGHEISNHAYSHPNMSQLSSNRATMEITKTEDLLQQKLGVKNKWFAPPSGDFNQQTVSIADGLGLRTVLWTLDTVDWRNPSPESIVTKINNKVEPGFLILMHPTRSSSQALKELITVIQNKGLQIGTVSQTLSSERILPSTVE